MSLTELGTRQSCQACGRPFYDLNRSPATCPKCGTALVPVARKRAAPRRVPQRAAPAPVEAPAEAGDDADVPTLDSEDDEEDEAASPEESDRD